MNSIIKPITIFMLSEDLSNIMLRFVALIFRFNMFNFSCIIFVTKCRIKLSNFYNILKIAKSWQALVYYL